MELGVSSMVTMGQAAENRTRIRRGSEGQHGVEHLPASAFLASETGVKIPANVIFCDRRHAKQQGATARCAVGGSEPGIVLPYASR